MAMNLADAQVWMRLDASPIREIKQIVSEELHRSPEDAQTFSFRLETKEVPSEDDEWESRIPTGRGWYTLTFADGAKFTFERDQEGVRLGEMPEITHIPLKKEERKIS